MLCASDTAPDEPSSVISVGSLLWSICTVAPENCGARRAINSGANESKSPRTTKRNARSSRSQQYLPQKLTSWSALMVSPPLRDKESNHR